MKQHRNICPDCDGSYYSVDGKCNACGAERKPDATTRRSFQQGKPSVGKRWSKKLHRYLKDGEGYPR